MQISVSDVARCCYEANRALCEVQGDFSQKRWSEAEEWQRESAENGVQYFIDNPEAPDSSRSAAEQEKTNE